MDYKINNVTLLAWQRSNRQEYYIKEISVQHPVKLKHFLKNPQEHSILLYVRLNGEESEQYRIPNLDDISRIDEESDYPSPPQGGDGGDWWQPPDDIPEDKNDDPGEQPPLPPPGPP